MHHPTRRAFIQRASASLIALPTALSLDRAFAVDAEPVIGATQLSNTFTTCLFHGRSCGT